MNKIYKGNHSGIEKFFHGFGLVWFYGVMAWLALVVGSVFLRMIGILK